MNIPKVSIIIPIYNVAQYIVRCLRSVVAQRYIADMEVILVDDCGTDNSIALAAEFLTECNDVDYKILHHAQNGGLSAARNTGLKAATGDYVYFLDSDDEITADCIEQLVQPLRYIHYDFVIGNYRAQPALREFPPLLLGEGLYQNNKDILHSYANGEWYMMAWNKLCNRDFLLKNALFFKEGVNHEDVIWSFELACKAESMYVIQKDTYIYRVREDSIMTGTSLDKDAETYAKAYAEMTKYALENRGISADIYTLLEGRKSTFLYSLLYKKRIDLYNKYYSILKEHQYTPILSAYRKKIVTNKQLVRDLHYCLPTFVGKWYKRLFYHIIYSGSRRDVEGRLWD